VKVLLTPWIWKMAWRDGRTARKKLLLATLTVVLGIGSLVAVTSFGNNLETAIQLQAKTLLGADLSIESRQPFSSDAEALMAVLGGEQSRQTSFTSMVYFAKNGATRLAQVRALEGAFPYYGVLETDPVRATQTFHKGPYALVDEGLMVQQDMQLGDLVKIGNRSFQIVGKLRKIPGETLANALISPRVYIPMRYLQETQLIQKGSIVRYKVYFKFPAGIDPDRLVQNLTPELHRLQLQADTVNKRKATISRAFENLSRFLNLVGFSAVLLAGLGVASTIYVYARDKVATTAILRCLGAQSGQAFAVYVLQAAMIGFIGSALGILLGTAAQVFLPWAIRDFLPVSVDFSFSPSGVAFGAAVGFGIALLFSLLPLCSLRTVSPLLSLRSSWEKIPSARDPLRWLIYAILLATIVLFARLQTEHWSHATIFAACLLGALGLLCVMARGVAFLLRRFLAPSCPYVLRQGLANLYRPKNQTTVLTLAMGLVTALIMTIYSTQRMLLDQIAQRSGENEPNMVLFDVQVDQAEPLVKLIHSFGLRLYQDVPVVTMRLAAINGVPVDKIRTAPSTRIPAWALRREYRSTYRNHLIETETIFAGKWRAASASSENVPISLEKDIADALGVTLGDKLTFTIDGVALATRVGSIREVDWHRVQPNFFVVFPTGVLEAAPQFRVLVTRADSHESSARVQRAVVQMFPNVSVIDIGLILATVDSVLQRVAFAVRMISFFIIFTALVVLASTVVSSHSERVKESLLLRTLGASRPQVLKIIITEYLCLGLCGGLSGIALSILVSWGLSYYFFATLAMPPLLWLVLLLLMLSGVTLVAGMWGSLRIFNRSPLEALRQEF
jgi:putative ABC transport system permease protein